MSYHIIINKNQDITYRQLLKNSFTPKDVLISKQVDPDDLIVDFNKFYLNNESSRGVALTVSNEAFDIELNTCASTADYLLAAKLAMAIAYFNSSTICPEFDDELTLEEFEANYGQYWAQSARLNGVDTLISLLKHNVEIKLPGCVRPFYFGNYVLDKLSKDLSNKELIADRLIDEIKKVQFIEYIIDDLEVPTLMDADFPEGRQTYQIILPDFKLLVQKSDWVVLRAGVGEMSEVNYQQFIQHPSLILTRLDEAQYVLEPIKKECYLEIMKQLTLVESQPVEVKPVENNSPDVEPHTNFTDSKWWQFWK